MNVAITQIVPALYRRIFLRPLGLNSQNSLAFWLLLLYGGILFGGLWFFQGNMMVPVMLLCLLSVALLMFLKPDYGLYLVIFLVLFFDQYSIPGFYPATYSAYFFKNLKEIPYLPFFNAGVINPVELLLLLLVTSVLTITIVMKDFRLRPVPVWKPFLLFVGCFLFSLFYGLYAGGDFLAALWEVRALFYFMVLYLLVPQIIRSRSQVKIFIWVCIAGIAVKAFQATGRFIELGFTTGGLDTLTNHEDPVFMVTLFILLFGFLAFRAKDKQKLWLLILLPVLLFGFYVGLRRAAYASFMVSFVTFMVLLPSATRWKFIKAGAPVFMGLIIYTAVFWNYGSEHNPIARPVQMIKAGFERPSLEENSEDYYSNLYRERENYNLAQTVVNNPVKGIGFGKKYEQPLYLVPIPFTLRDYIPHNEIFWILVKMGGIGFFAFWFFFNSFVAKGTKVFSRLSDPYLKAVTLFIVVAVINQMVVSYFDLQLTYYRNMIYLGCVMGLLPAVITLAEEETQKEKNESEKEAGHD